MYKNTQQIGRTNKSGIFETVEFQNLAWVLGSTGLGSVAEINNQLYLEEKDISLFLIQFH